MMKFWMAASVLALGLTAAAESRAQNVDGYEFRKMRERLGEMEEEVARMRNAMAGGSIQGRLDALEDEIARLTNQTEQLEFSQRKLEDETKRRMDDIEYRVIELEGGDPSILFQDEGSNEQGLLKPAPPRESAVPAQNGNTLGVITTTAPAGGAGGGADFDAGVAAVRAGRPAEGRAMLQDFLTANPGNSQLADAHFWIGESYFVEGDYQNAANRYLDGATLNSSATKAPESMLKLGVALSLLGKTEVACKTLREVPKRFPAAQDIAARAYTEASRSGCS